MWKARFLVLLALAGCSSGGGSLDAGPTLGWKPLITKAWSLPPGGENTSDLEITVVDRDIYFGGIRPIAPKGTHHTLLARGANVASGNIIYASGVGTNALMFPTGKGLKLTAGDLVGLQLHVFNTTDTSLAGTSGVEIFEVDPKDVADEVDLFLPGPKDLMIPAEQTTTLSGTCTVRERQTVFALFPHMHQLGTHVKTTLTHAGVPKVIHDAPYRFDEQAFLSIDPTTLEQGDTITTECTWTNPSKQVVTYGESSTTEMCYSIMFRYPAQSQEFCTN